MRVHKFETFQQTSQMVSQNDFIFLFMSQSRTITNAHQVHAYQIVNLETHQVHAYIT
jgi:hypothetical protein